MKLKMKTYWMTSDEGSDVKEYVEIRIKEKRIAAWGTTGHWKSETGNATSFEKFLKGEWDEWILRTHGKSALSEMKEAVQSLENET
jgi:hypothetical protein